MNFFGQLLINTFIFLAFILKIIDQLLHNKNIEQSPMPCIIQMAQLLEQTLLRFAQCTFPNDLIIASAVVLTKTYIVKFSPEVRKFFLNFLNIFFESKYF